MIKNVGYKGGNSNMKSALNIAVIGAGISGLSCATSLQQAGFNITVFDKSRGPSGRMSTRLGDGWQCDHGAQYFTARDSEFYTEVMRWQKVGVAELWDARLHVTDGITFTDKNKLKDAQVARFVGVPHNTSPAKFLSESLVLKTNTTIQELEQSSNTWRIKSAEHGWLEQRFDAVILALPAPQAVPLLALTSPPLANIASAVKMRGCWALMLRFSAPLDLPFDGLFVNKAPLSWVARNSSKPKREGEETWLLHASAEWSEAHIEDEPESVAATMIVAFLELGGILPQAWSAHRWRYAEAIEYLECGSVWDENAKIGLCGDWLNGGKVQGAWLSGRKLAQQVINCDGFL